MNTLQMQRKMRRKQKTKTNKKNKPQRKTPRRKTHRRQSRRYVKSAKHIRGGATPSPHTIQFDNGCVFVHQSCDPSVPTASIRIFCKVGSIHEPEHQYGVSHLIEHLCFHYIYDNSAVSHLIQSSVINATTTKEYTVYKIDCATTDIPDALSLFNTMLFDMSFTQEMVDREYRVILAETETRKSPQLDKIIFAGTSYEHHIDASEYHTTHKLNATDVNAYYHKHYIPQNMVISIVSNQSWETVLNIVNPTHVNGDVARGQHVFATRARAPITPTFTPQLAYTTPADTIIVDGQNIRIAFRACAYTHPDAPVLELLECYLNHGFANVVFNKLRILHGDAYSIHASYEHYTYVGAFDITVLVGNKLTQWLLSPQNENNIIKTIKTSLQTDMDTVDWETVKQFMLTQRLKELQTTPALANYNGLQYMLGSLPYSDYFHAKIAPITLDQMKHVISTYFVFSNAFISIPSALTETTPTTSIQSILRIL